MRRSSQKANMVKVIITEPHVIQPGYHLARGWITQESTALVRRKVPQPTDLSHPASRRNTLHKMHFAEAARAWSALSPAEKYVYSQMWRLPPEEHHSPRSTQKFLSGRDLFTADYIRTKKAGSQPDVHLYPYCPVIRGPLTIGLPDAELRIRSLKLGRTVYLEKSDIDGWLPTVHLSPYWAPFRSDYSRPCFYTVINNDEEFFRPYPYIAFTLPPDFCQLIWDSDYCPTGWRTPLTRLHGSKIPFTKWEWLSPPGRGIRIDYRILNSYTIELFIQQYPGNDWGTLESGITNDLKGTRSSTLQVWTYFNLIYPGDIESALLPPHPFAIIDCRGEIPVVTHYRDEPWED